MFTSVQLFKHGNVNHIRGRIKLEATAVFDYSHTMFLTTYISSFILSHCLFLSVLVHLNVVTVTVKYKYVSEET